MIQIHRTYNDVNSSFPVLGGVEDLNRNFIILQCYEKNKHDKVYAIYSKVDPITGNVSVYTTYGSRQTKNPKEHVFVGSCYNISDRNIKNNRSTMYDVMLSLALEKQDKGYVQVRYAPEYYNNIPREYQLTFEDVQKWTQHCFNTSNVVQTIKTIAKVIIPQNPFDAEVAELILG